MKPNCARIDLDKPILFHSIGLDSHDSAAVRKFIVDHQLMEKIEFLNINYEGPQERLRARIGVVEAPVLFIGEQVFRGRSQILDWLNANLLAKK
jgi:hypothetical protein